ncbi:hypothetical protein F5Y01DRAFT_309081 [Xylaria sp. FL0043]|nr:hypothetical protein F5Y01DRAFT_309081 [Xylaria sp. FL0043]
MCIKYTSSYPCKHRKSWWEFCSKAKAAKLLRIGNPGTPCEKVATKEVAPDLSDSCGSTCLTKPWQCGKCSSQKKQLSWRCADCYSLRDDTVLVWTPCQCPKHQCGESALGKSFCRQCSDVCVPKGPILKWVCHACGSLTRTFATEMECQCLHIRCGKCKALPTLKI